MSEGRIRAPHVAGAFYPRDPGILEARVSGLLAAAGWQPGPRAASPVAATLAALVVPHAGYDYSGPVAAAGYARLAAEPRAPAHLAILGPAHFVARRGATIPEATAWETPLGRVAIDPLLRAAAVAAGATTDDRPHAPEHAIEVQLPFLAVVCPGIPVLPVSLADIEPDAVADLVDRLMTVPDTLVVVSSDLSHYLDLARARVVDGRTADAVEALDDEAIAPEDACGYYGLRGILRWSARHGLRVRRLALATSADTAGDPDRVVGYAAFAIERQPATAVA